MAEEPIACCFCGVEVVYTDTDPVGIGVIRRWRPQDEDADWTVYAHRQCLFERFDPESRQLFELLDE